MATTTALQGIHVPQSTDTPNGPTQMTALANDLESLVLMRFASAAARTAAFTAAGISPVAGMRSYRSDGGPSNGHEYWNAVAGAWRVYQAWKTTTLLGASAASITITGIPTYLRRLDISWTARSDASSSSSPTLFRIDSDSGANYRYQYMNVFATTVTAAAVTASASAGIGNMPAALATANVFGAGLISCHGWDAPHANHLVGTAQAGFIDNTSGNSSGSNTAWAYTGSSAGGYTSITILPGSGNLIAGSQVTVIGQE